MAAPDYTSLYQGAGQAANIDPLLLRAIAEQESDEGRNIGPSSAGARGIMQFIPETAARYGVNVNDAKSSIYGAGRYMDDLLQYYGGDLNSALSAYGGDAGGKAGYANSVVAKYRALQTPAASSGDQGGIKITMKPATPSPFLPKSVPGADNYLAGSNIDEIEKHVGKSLSSIPDAKAQGPDFAGALTGGASTTKAAPAAPASEKPDFAGALSSPPQPAAPPLPAPVAGIPEAGQPPAAQPQPVRPADVTIPSADSAPTPQVIEGTPISQPPPPSWWQRNVATPFNAMMHPAAAQPPNNYLLNAPLLQSTGSGLVQGVRDLYQTGANLADYVDRNVPAAAAIDRYFGQDAAADVARTQANTAAYNQQYGSSIPATVGRFTGNLAATLPVGPVARLAGEGAAAVPLLARAAPVVSGAAAGGLQNMLVSGGYGQDWRQAAAEGVAGGGLVGGALGLIGNRLAGSGSEVQQLADRLGVPVSRGQATGGVAQRVEDTAAVLPGSGASQFATQQRHAIAGLLNREMGESGNQINAAGLAQARQRIGNDIDNAIGRITISAPPGNTSFVDRLRAIRTEALANGPNTPEAHRIPALLDNIDDVLANNNGTIPGNRLLDLLKRGNPLDMASRQLGNVGDRADDIREALLNAAQASPTASPGAVSDLQRGRYQWKVANTIQPAIQRTVGGTEEMSLPALANAIQNNRYIDKLADEPMPNLMRLINSTRNLASSGTAERSLWQKLVGLSPTEGLGGGALWYLAHPQNLEQAAGVFAIPTAANILASRGLRFGPGLGVPAFDTTRQIFNPLTPRLLGPSVGQWVAPQLQPQPAQ